MSDGRVLFLSHDASRTGAPLLLLHLLRWLRASTDLEFDVALRRGGDLEDAFSEVAGTRLRPLESDTPPRSHRWFRRFLGRGSGEPVWIDHSAVAALRRNRPALIYSNTITNGHVVDALAEPGSRVLTHVHELEPTIRINGPENLRLVLGRTTLYLCGAEAVRRNLVERHGVPPGTTEVFHEFIDASHVTRACDPASRAPLRAEFGASPDDFVVGGCGTTDWRKGPDAFVLVAAALRKRHPDLRFRFVWIGGHGPGTMEHDRLLHDADRLGVGENVRFLGARPDASAAFPGFDAFALTSREDSFPLVCLEAGAAGLPILCFAGAGGAAELVEDECGFVVPYLDFAAAAERLGRLALSPELRRDRGSAARDRVLARHDVTACGPRLHAIIRRLAGGAAASSSSS